MRRYIVNECRQRVRQCGDEDYTCASFTTGDTLHYDVVRDQSDGRSIEDTSEECVYFGARSELMSNTFLPLSLLFNFVSTVYCILLRLYIEILFVFDCEQKYL